MQYNNKQGGLETGRERIKKEEEKEVREESIFLPLIPMGISTGLFTQVATFHFLLCICLCVYVCLCVVCMRELCEGLAPPWWFIAVGSGPICFWSVSCLALASLQCSPGPPDAEPGWDPSETAWNQHHKHTLPSLFHSPFLSLTPLLSPFSNLLPLRVQSFTIAVQHPHAQTHSVTLTYSLLLSLLLCLTLALSCSFLLSRSRLPSDTSFKHSITCKHPHMHNHAHLGRQSHTLTWITLTAPPQCSLSAAHVTLANTFHFLWYYIQNGQACEFYLCKFKLKLSSGLGGGKNPSCCVIAGTEQFVVVWVISPGFHCCFLQLFSLIVHNGKYCLQVPRNLRLE